MASTLRDQLLEREMRLPKLFKDGARQVVHTGRVPCESCAMQPTGH